MHNAFVFTAVLFAAKLLWNIATPFAVTYANRRWMKSGGAKPNAVSMGPLIEIGLWLAMLLMAFLRPSESLGLGLGSVFVWGSALIAGSYAVVWLFAAILRRLFLSGLEQADER
jgi:hypothetical protein